MEPLRTSITRWVNCDQLCVGELTFWGLWFVFVAFCVAPPKSGAPATRPSPGGCMSCIAASAYALRAPAFSLCLVVRCWTLQTVEPLPRGPRQVGGHITPRVHALSHSHWQRHATHMSVPLTCGPHPPTHSATRPPNHPRPLAPQLPPQMSQISVPVPPGRRLLFPGHQLRPPAQPGIFQPAAGHCALPAGRAPAARAVGGGGPPGGGADHACAGGRAPAE